MAWQWAYSAFGDEQPTIGAKRFTSETTTPTTGATSIPEVTFNLRYPGQYFDPETKLHYNYFRTYAPGTGRYTQGDPIGLDGGWNRFAYVSSDPLSRSDPLGLQERRGGGLPPTWDPTNNLNPAYLRYNNCYSYALNRSGREGSAFWGAGGLEPGEISGRKFGSVTCEDILDAARRDGAVNLENGTVCPTGYHTSELFVRPRRWNSSPDYHWYRQDIDGNWSDKIGAGRINNLGKNPAPPSGYPEQCGKICLPN
ncbi:RHS repeat-associated core domain-containing protein [Acidovorax sp. HMWF029]|uniref:RHS repeat-associated core domain-containing protein n=1 Tax=Acidovorax sp. HMWF029 TaxID=2056863 RepID=UPI003519B2A4